MQKVTFMMQDRSLLSFPSLPPRACLFPLKQVSEWLGLRGSFCPGATGPPHAVLWQDVKEAWGQLEGNLWVKRLWETRRVFNRLAGSEGQV